MQNGWFKARRLFLFKGRTKEGANGFRQTAQLLTGTQVGRRGRAAGDGKGTKLNYNKKVTFLSLELKETPLKNKRSAKRPNQKYTKISTLNSYLENLN